MMRKLNSTEVKAINGGGFWESVKKRGRQVGNGLKEFGHGFSEGLDGW